ncbi:MAG: SRPBCC domain-containing protein [Flavobacteriales bacterium]|nr:SRPBCC domain-containing protein [Flavobacteriales bacterium]
MTQLNYARTLIVPRAPEDVYRAIADIAAWWTINVEGSAEKVGDAFIIQFNDPVTGRLIHRTAQRVIEAVPGRRLAWTVTECHMPWLEDKEEWKGTTMVFEIAPVVEGSRIEFVHIGLTAEVECFEQCERGWAYFLIESLQELISTGEGRPDTSGRNHMDTIGHVHTKNT